MEIEKLEDDYLGGNLQLKYLRYNFPITENSLNELNFTRYFSEKDVDSLIEMSNAGNRELLYEIGLAASKQINEIHF